MRVLSILCEKIFQTLSDGRNSMLPQLIAIDLDGTLLDSVGDLHAAVVSMQTACQLPSSSESDVRGWIGNGIERLVHRALTGSMSLDAEADRFQYGLGLFKQAYHDINGTHVTIYPGVVDGLEWIVAHEITAGVVTNKSREFTVPLLQRMQIDHFFSHVVCGDDVVNKKPAPDALLYCAALANSSPQGSVMIGDSVNDFRAARNASFKAIAVSYGYNHGMSPSSLPEYDRPDFIIDSLAQLSEVLA